MKNIILGVISIILITSCGGGTQWQKNPVDDLIKKMDHLKTFSIVLYDMDVEGNFTQEYKHQYKIITVENDEPKEEITQWFTVPEKIFMQHENDMGMEIAAKTADGKISKVAAPAGYSNYVGNKQYGHWVSDGSGGSFWEFYGKYAMMSSMLNLALMPARMSYWNDYHTGYYGSRPYYGSSSDGSKMYGTQSAFQKKTSQNSRWSTRQRTRTSKFGNSFGSKTTRSSSRWGSSSGSGFRSRGGGFGK